MGTTVEVNWLNIDSWMDVVDHLWVGIVMIVITVFPTLLSLRNHRSIKTETAVIKEQLVNGHKSPMRSDLDKALEAIHGLSEQVSGLRHDLKAEQHSRRSQIEDLRNDVDRLFKSGR